MPHHLRLLLVCVLALGGLASGCTTIGPPPKVRTDKAELKRRGEVEKILVLPTLGIGSGASAKDLATVVPAGVYHRHGDITTLMAALDSSAKELGLEADTTTILPSGWQLAFYKFVTKKKKKKLAVKLPFKNEAPVEADKALKELAEEIESNKDELESLIKAVATGKAADLVEAAAEAGKALAPVERFHRSLLLRIKVDYVVASVLEGDATSYANGKPVVLHAAMINRETGKMRYYAVGKAKKGDFPATFDNLVGIVGRKMFEDIEKYDGLPPPPEED